MSHEMFHDVNDPSITLGGTRACSVPLSIVAHSAILAALIVIPLLAPTLPVPPTMLSFMTVVSELPPVPVVPLQASTAHGHTEVPSDTIPLDAPSAIGPEPTAPNGLQIPGPIENVGGSVPGGLFGESALPPLPAPPPPAVSVPLRAGGQIRPPTKIKDVPPVYPSIAQASRVEGVVIIEATIGVDGRVQNAKVLRSIPWLDLAALDAVRQWEYTPTLLNSTPVPVIITVTVAFKLR